MNAGCGHKCPVIDKPHLQKREREEKKSLAGIGWPQTIVLSSKENLVFMK